MKRKTIPFITPVNITGDPLSRFLEEISFIPHAFGHQYQNSRAICDYRVIGDFELLYIINGESRITIGKKEYICGRGDIVLIPPFTMHKIQTTETNPHDNFWIHFDVNPFYRHEDFLSAILGDCGNCVHIGYSDYLENLYNEIEKEFELQRPGNAALIRSLFTQIIIYILRGTNGKIQYGKQDSKFAAERNIVNQCLEYIRSNIEKPIRTEDLLNAVHVSESYLFKAFSRIMNMSPNKYIQLYKVKLAEQLMKTTTFSFKEISDKLGFSSPYHFSKTFKKYYGFSPRQYMNKFHG